MKKAAYVFGAAGFLALVCALVGRLVGDPHIFMGSAILSWIILSGSLTLLGVLAALLAEK
ncbi:MAG TPA: hypothetical protein HPP83_10120 [Candidatus Hydrogenedentes bacterium]|nr:hypothetical protein [Candidatus Hydrogenedentota bacterium]